MSAPQTFTVELGYAELFELIQQTKWWANNAMECATAAETPEQCDAFTQQAIGHTKRAEELQRILSPDATSQREMHV